MLRFGKFVYSILTFAMDIFTNKWSLFVISSNKLSYSAYFLYTFTISL